jgi:hypothetical protein
MYINLAEYKMDLKQQGISLDHKNRKPAASKEEIDMHLQNLENEINSSD